VAQLGDSAHMESVYWVGAIGIPSASPVPHGDHRRRRRRRPHVRARQLDLRPTVPFLFDLDSTDASPNPGQLGRPLINLQGGLSRNQYHRRWPGTAGLDGPGQRLRYRVVQPSPLLTQLATRVARSTPTWSSSYALADAVPCVVAHSVRHQHGESSAMTACTAWSFGQCGSELPAAQAVLAPRRDHQLVEGPQIVALARSSVEKKPATR